VEELLPLRLIAATRNLAKLREIERVVDGLAAIEPLPVEAPLPPGVEARIESGASIHENAEAKAQAWSSVLSDRLVIASDGGLVVPALGDRWRPVHTRRFNGPASTDMQRAQRLLQIAQLLEEVDRAIGWQEALSVGRNGMLVASMEVSSPATGFLAESVTPEFVEAAGGFWVSALWRCPEYDGRLLVELTPEERDCRVDHWTLLRGRLGPLLNAWRAKSDWK
jgi:inosine/xanthosine triphosphate pyrophosphatase family protein